MWRKGMGVALALLVGWAWASSSPADVAPGKGAPPVPWKVSAPVAVKAPLPHSHGKLGTASEAHKRVSGPPISWTFHGLRNPGDTLHFDDPNTAGSNAIGLVSGGTYQAAIKLTPDELGPYAGYAVTAVLFYHYEAGTHSGRAILYGTGFPPSDTLTTEPYTVTGQGWYLIPLSAPVPIDPAQDLWVAVEITHVAGEYPIGVDAGPAVDGKGDWVYAEGLPWDELQNLDPNNLDLNWDIRAIVEPYQLPDHDIWTQTILAPTGEIPANVAVTPTARFRNVGSNTETFNAYFEIYHNDSLVYTDTYSSVTLDSAGITEITFTDWTPTEAGAYLAVAYHDLADDNPGNDTAQSVFYVRVIGTDYLIVDLDPTPGSGGVIDQKLMGLGYAGRYTTSPDYLVFDTLSQYSTVWVFCGIFSNNTRITPEQGAQLEQYLQAGGRLYIEGGDLWGFDPGSGGWDLLPWTGVASAEDGSGDLYTVEGAANALIPQVAGNSWAYGGENNWIDRLTPDANPPHGGTAEGYLQNPDANYFCGVAYDQGVWRTVGNSFELGGLSARAPLDSLVAWIMDFLYAPPPEHDVAAMSILEPHFLFIDETATPAALVANLGQYDETFDVTFEILDPAQNPVYSATVTGVALAAGARDTVVFSPDFVPPDTGHFTAVAYVSLAGDERPNNDTTTATVVVADTISVPLPGSATLGPDPCSYVGASSQDLPGDPALAFQWIDPTPGTPLSLGDDAYTTVTLPFPFPFYDQMIEEINVCSNGFLETSTTTSYSNQPLPVADIENFIGYWDDLNPSSAGQVYYLGTPQYAVFAWVDVPHFGASVGNTYEIILFPNGVIKMQFLSMDPSYTNSSTIGIQKGDGSEGCYLQYVADGNPPNHVVTDSTVIMFWHQVYEHEVGVVDIRPQGPTLPNPQDLVVTLRNNGQNPEDFTVYVEIVDTLSGTTIISAHQPVTALQPGETLEVPFFQWGPLPNRYYQITAWIDLADERPNNDTLQVMVWTALQLGDVIFGPVNLQDQVNDNLLLGVEFDGTHFYVTGSGADGSSDPPHYVYEFDATGTFTGHFWYQPDNTNTWGWRDLAYDGTWPEVGFGNGHFYASSSNVVDEWHLFAGGLVLDGSFPGPENPNRALAWNPECDHFFTANFNGPIYEFDRNGNILGTYSNAYAIYGAAYDPGSVDEGIPYIWFATQEFNQYGVANTIYQWNLATHSYTGISIQPPPAGSDATAGGLAFWPDFMGASVLFELVQGDPYDYLVGYFVRFADETRTPVAVAEGESIRYPFALRSVRPNPARDVARISFSVPEKAPVTIAVYDISGRQVATLLQRTVEPGVHSLTWNATDRHGRKVPAGVYFVELRQGDHRAHQRLILVR